MSSSFMQKLYEDTFENGSVAVKSFQFKFLQPGKHEAYKKLIHDTTKALYDTGLTPMEIKGFYELAAILSMAEPPTE